MNKRAIQKTAIAFWCEEDQCFIVQSALMDSIIGAGDTVEEATREFNDILSDAYEAYLEGRMGEEKPGRPAKNRVALNTDVKAETKESVKAMASQFECSQGEIIDFLLAFQQHSSDSNGTKTDNLSNPQVPQQVPIPRNSIPGPGKDSSYRVSEAGPFADIVNDLNRRLTALESSLPQQAKDAPKKNSPTKSSGKRPRI